MNNLYEDTTELLSGVIGFITFVAAYIYCISSYGFLLGFGLGWIPSMMLAVLVAGAVALFWPILLLGLVALIVFAFL